MRLQRILFVCLLVSLVAVAGGYPPKRGQTEIIQFPQIGKVRVEGIVRAHQLPQVVFSDSSGKILLSLELGAGFLSTEYIDPDDPQGDPYPIVRFRVIDAAGLPTPIVFAGIMTGGGTECTYGGQLVAEINGKLAPISKPLPDVSDDGGYSIGKLREGGGFELAAWSMIWRVAKEPHYAAHDHWVRIYRFNASSGRFEFVKKYTVTKPREVTFPNLLREIPDFGC